jgi:hypothetical protein
MDACFNDSIAGLQHIVGTHSILTLKSIFFFFRVGIVAIASTSSDSSCSIEEETGAEATGILKGA